METRAPRAGDDQVALNGALDGLGFAPVARAPCALAGSPGGGACATGALRTGARVALLDDAAFPVGGCDRAVAATKRI